mmetsp:Transcript_13428/g.39232  ORF Transcript_13428/g.39232 Transcript_13428/m.39232 type:complete len:280 (+) Transcript_13428:414-1253(+)
MHARLPHGCRHHRLLLLVLCGQCCNGGPLCWHPSRHLHRTHHAIVDGGALHPRHHRRHIGWAILHDRHWWGHVRGRLANGDLLGYMLGLHLRGGRHEGRVDHRPPRHGLHTSKHLWQGCVRWSRLQDCHHRRRVRWPLLEVHLAAGVLRHLPGRVEARGVHCQCRRDRGTRGQRRRRRRWHIRQVHRHGLAYHSPRHCVCHSRCLARVGDDGRGLAHLLAHVRPDVLRRRRGGVWGWSGVGVDIGCVGRWLVSRNWWRHTRCLSRLCHALPLLGDRILR